MTITIGILFILMLIGAVCYLLSKDAERKELFRILFFCALLAMLMQLNLGTSGIHIRD